MRTNDITDGCFQRCSQQIEEKLLELSGIFSFNIATYAVMSNHYHVILNINQPVLNNGHRATLLALTNRSQA